MTRVEAEGTCLINLDVRCASCDRVLKTESAGKKLAVHPCTCKAAKAAKVVRLPPGVRRMDPDPNTLRMRRHAKGRYITHVAYQKLAERNAWLEKCIDRMLGNGNFVTCPQCRLPNVDGYVCACGYDGCRSAGDFET